MRVRLGAAFASAIVLGVGFLTMLGLLVGEGQGPLSDAVNGLGIRVIVSFFLQVVVVTVAVTILIGVLNLLTVHVNRIRTRNAVYSIVLLVSFFAAVLTYILERDTSMILLEKIQVSVESALAGLLFFALVYGAYRVMHRRVTWSGALFVAVILIVLIGALPLPGMGAIASVSNWLMAIPVSAGARGILLGIALATVVAGVRVLIGQDRSYRE